MHSTRLTSVHLIFKCIPNSYFKKICPRWSHRWQISLMKNRWWLKNIFYIFRDRLQSIRVQEESRIFGILMSKLSLQETGDLRILALISRISMKILAKLQSDFKEHSVELDFFRWDSFPSLFNITHGKKNCLQLCPKFHHSDRDHSPKGSNSTDYRPCIEMDI